MHIFKTLQVLIDDILLVDIFEDVGTDYCVKIGIHEVEDKIDITVVFSANDILQSNDVLVTRKLLQENNLAERSLSISSILEGIEIFLERYNFFCPFIDGLPDNTVGSLS